VPEKAKASPEKQKKQADINSVIQTSGKSVLHLAANKSKLTQNIIGNTVIP
jgi:septal ring factor EnvC (AmiA/AmiB activator)